MKNDKRQWVPDICYEEYEDSELTSGLPFMQIPKEKEVPNILFFFASTETEEFDVGADGEPEPIVEMELYQFACMQYLQEGLSIEDYDKVRDCLGLLTIEEARAKGKTIVAKQAEDIKNISNKTKNLV